MKVPFNKPYLSGKEQEAIRQLQEMCKYSGDGKFTHLCQEYLSKTFAYNKVLMTTSCTSAIEMATLVLDIKPEDEIIIPSYTFVSSANPFVQRGANLIFADSQHENPNVSLDQIKPLVTSKTKAIVLVHYAGTASSDLEKIVRYTKDNDIYLIEDAAQCIGAKHENKYLGSFGDIAALSFHDTKNIHCGEGGCIVINNEELVDRAHIIWDKGTNRRAFINGSVEKYEWVDIGGSYAMSELNAAFLWTQLQDWKKVNKRRREIWQYYHDALIQLEKQAKFTIPNREDHLYDNGHIFYVVLSSKEERNAIMRHLYKEGISAVFHYQSLHRSKYFNGKYEGKELVNANKFTDCLLRLPLYYDLKQEKTVCKTIWDYYN